MEFITFLEGQSDTAVLIRLIIAMICGCIIGYERISNRHSAGIKTFALVSLGSAVATVLNIYLANMEGLNADVSRIPAGVVSGIGFLGAGTIIVTGRSQIKGLTTAASLWVTACMGMAIGAGYMPTGLMCFLLILITNKILLPVTQYVEGHSRYLNIYIEVEKNNGISKLKQQMQTWGFSVKSISKSKGKTLQHTDTGIIVGIDLRKKFSHKTFLNYLNELDFVSYVEEI